MPFAYTKRRIARCNLARVSALRPRDSIRTAGPRPGPGAWPTRLKDEKKFEKSLLAVQSYYIDGIAIIRMAISRKKRSWAFLPLSFKFSELETASPSLPNGPESALEEAFARQETREFKTKFRRGK